MTLPTIAQPPPSDWVAQSNQNAQVLIEGLAQFAPESAGQLGATGLDEQILDLKPGFSDRQKQTAKASITTLQARLPKTTDARVRQDLDILIGAAKDTLQGIELDEKYLPYTNVTEIVFGGLQALLDDQVAPFLIDGIGQLFQKYQITGYEPAYAKLKAQLTAYNEFVQTTILPKSRADFREPPEVYAFSLKKIGVDIPPEKLAAVAHVAFDEIQQKMQVLAPQVAKQQGFKVTDYRQVIRQLKQEQITGKAILPHYEQRIKDIEQIIRREKLVTLPTRSLRVRLATEAESAQLPSPFFQAPRLLGNTGEIGEFVLPLRSPTATTPTAQQFDDFTYPAASWTLTAHEARPGHELQYASMLEGGLSAARAIFAANSVNLEGWALYAESIVKPYMPLEGQLISLQFQLLRAARAFLDPELQAGKITPAQALKILTQDVMFSEGFATQEVERYTFRMPGQATSYFYGYQRLLAIRSTAEKALGAKFNLKKFHDFILSQGLLPPNLLERAVRESFVKSQTHHLQHQK